MTGLLIKVEHHPENSDGIQWCAQMHRDLPQGTEYVPDTTAIGGTREEAIELCKAAYALTLAAEPVEWLRYDETAPEPQSLKAVQ